MPKKRVFVSFDFDNDKTLKDFIVGQSKLPDSPFDVADHSLKEAQPRRSPQGAWVSGHGWDTPVVLGRRAWAPGSSPSETSGVHATIPAATARFV